MLARGMRAQRDSMLELTHLQEHAQSHIEDNALTIAVEMYRSMPSPQRSVRVANRLIGAALGIRICPRPGRGADSSTPARSQIKKETEQHD